MKNTIHLTESFRNLAKGNLVLLEPENNKEKQDTARLTVSGYVDVMYLITDIVKTCIVALEQEPGSGSPHGANKSISHLLSIILDLIPYEEADLLDVIREALLQPIEETDDDWLVENIFLTPPAALLNTT